MSPRRIFSIWLLLFATGTVNAFSPESPEVRAMVGRGLDFLARSPADGSRYGELALAGLSFIKSNKPDHPIVKHALKSISSPDVNWRTVDVYTVGLGIIFLSEVKDDNDKNAVLLQKLTDELLRRQKPHGGFGYDNMQTGDVSQTQYACLALWGARLKQAKVPQEAIEKVCDWLVRVQDPSGGWGYQGADPGTYQRVRQVGGSGGAEPSLSCSAAGLGSVCICADLLGIHRVGTVEQEDEESNLPEALKVIKKAKPPPEQAASLPLVTKLDPAMVERAIEDGGNWFAVNYKIETGPWGLYYLYGLERCESFRNLYYRKFPKEAPWYNDGVLLLGRKIAGDHWQGDYSPIVSTSFAILFLQRSSQKLIVKKHKDLGEGVLTSGKGLPTDLANASVKRGKVVDSPLAGEVDDVVAMLEDEENPELARLLNSDEEIKLDPALTKRTGDIAKLRGKVRSGSWEARMVAVKSLGKVRDLSNVPSLLYALTDPDVRVVREADAALRFISRKFDGVGLPAEPDRKAIAAARTAWRQWYLGIRPDAQLLD